MRRSVALLAFVLLAGCTSSPAANDSPSEGVAPPAEADVVRGRLTAAASTVSVEIPIDAAGHGRLAILLTMTTNLPQNRLTVAVAGPDDRVAETGTSPILYVFPGTRPVVSFATPPTGAWTAEVRLASGAAADFELHWCADSQDAPGPQANLACQRSF